MKQYTIDGKKLTASLFLALISTIAFSSNTVITTGLSDPQQSISYYVANFFYRFGQVLNGFDIAWAIFFLALVVLFYIKSMKVHTSYVSSWILSFLFAFFMLFGRSYSAFDSWKFIFANKYQFLIALFLFAGYLFFFNAGLSILLRLVDSGKTIHFKSRKQSKFRILFERKTFLVSAVFIFLCWLPVLLIFYPGSVPHDGLRQLNMFFGVNTISNHHPIFSTWIMGSIMYIGRLFWNDNFGIFLNVLFQSVICCLIFAQSIKLLKELKVPYYAQLFVLLFFAITPIWAGYMQAVIKDTLYTGIFALYVIYVLLFIKEKQVFFTKKSRIVLLILSGLLVCLLRNNGIYIVAPTGIAMTIAASKKFKIKTLLAGFLIPIIIFELFSSVLYPALGIEGGSIKEALSIPFQQTARYATEYGDEVTAEEESAIAAVLDYDNLSNNYNPEISDSVKNTFHAKSKQALLNYFKIWFQMLLKHPGVYIEATFNNTYAYFYPEQTTVMAEFQYYIKGAPVNTGFFDIHYIDSLSDLRQTYNKFTYLLWDVPVLGLLYSPAIYSWIVIFLLTMFLRKKRFAAIVPLIPSILNILICVASPVNGYLRYALPVIAVTPLLIAWFAYQNKNRKEIETIEKTV